MSMERHQSVEAVTKYLKPNPKLAGTQASISAECYSLSEEILHLIEEDSPELTVGLRKLLEAKDCFVRASLDL